MHIGVVLPQAGNDWSKALESARHAEEIGADSVWVVDHLLGFPPERGILEAWTMLSALAASTSRVQLGAQVFCQSFRNPALFAKMAATLDQVSGGRVRLIVGAGWLETEYDQFGYDFPEPALRVEQTEEAIHILKGMLSGSIEPFTFKGSHYRVDDVVNVPQPVHPPMPIEVGAARDRMMRLIGRLGDGWNCPGVALPVFENRREFLEKACAKAGRSINDLVLSCQIPCAVGDDEAARHPRLQSFSPQLGLVGSVDQAVERAGELMGQGVTDFLTIVPPGPQGAQCLERLVGEVRPQVAR
jgi:alkanesulfonate monooxygenase SsuD/methylene tetrahydromethanopterin reductase-like flavin-dependent oxidoreductase (luciferase family)